MRRLQLTGYRASNYARPGDRWTCGGAAEGHPCALGPTSQGGCGATCTPRAVAGGGVACGRPGSPCGDGPVADGRGGQRCSQVGCQPRPSLRRLRGLVSLGAVLLTCALLGLGLSYPGTRDAIASPGPLSAPHAALACVDCHAAAAPDAPAWPVSAWKREHRLAQLDSDKCRTCHQMADEGWAQAHSLPGAELAAVQERSEARWSGAAEGSRPRPGPVLQGALELARLYGLRKDGDFDAHHRLDCALCHAEHGGRAVTLTEVAEQRCQICHTVPFDSFEDGHPEFTTFGARRLPGNSIFTHWTHYRSESRFGHDPPDCRECHEPDPEGRHMLVKSNVFETVCLRCHQHRADLGPVELVHALPGPALGWLDDLNKRPPHTPELPEVKPTALMRLLMPAADHAGVEKNLKSLRVRYRGLLRDAPEDKDGDGTFSKGDGLDARDLKKLDKAAEDAAPVRAYTAEVVKLLDALSRGDLTPVQAALGLGPADLAGLRAALPTDPLRGFREAWWASRPPAERRLALPAPANLGGPWQGVGTWAADDEGGGLRYQDYGHEDPFLRAWLDLAPRLPDGSPQQALLQEAFSARCGKCHLDPKRPAGERLQWEALTRHPEAARRLTHFAHAPHLRFAPECTDCHVLPDKEPERAAPDFVLTDLWRVRGAIQPDGSATGCMNCHNERRYGASCQTCHDYHASALAPGLGGASFEKPAAPAPAGPGPGPGSGSH